MIKKFLRALSAALFLAAPAVADAGQPPYPIPGRLSGGTPYQEGVFLGPRAGASVGSTVHFGMVGIGPDSLRYNTSTSAEAMALGAFSQEFEVTGVRNTTVGEHTMGYDTASSASTGIGNDTMRDAMGLDNDTAIGSQAMDNGGGIVYDTAIGQGAQYGNALAITFGGSITVGDVLTLTFTSANSSVVGVPDVVSYTVKTGDTIASLVGDFGALLSSSGITATLPDGNTALYENGVQLSGGNVSPAYAPDVLPLQFPGTETTGWEITATPSCTGTCTETMTVTNGYSGSNNDSLGVNALMGIALTTGSYNIAIGDFTLGALSGASSFNTAAGYSVAPSATTASQNAFFGYEVALNATTASNNAAFGYEAGEDMTTATQDVLLGYQAGQSLTTVQGDTAAGYRALQLETGGGNNTAIGELAGKSITSGYEDTILGFSVGSTTLTTGQYNILIGTSNSVDAQTASQNYGIDIGNVITGYQQGATNPTVCTIGQPCILGVLRSANLNSTADQAITVAPRTSGQAGYMPTATKYIVTGVWVDNCSAASNTAAGGVYTAASKGGTTLVAASQTYGNCSSATTMQTATLAAAAASNTLTASTLYLSLTTAQGSADTGDVYVYGVPFN